jgi:hypothetical protein
MTTTSQRAIAASQDRIPDPRDRNDQLEVWRIAAMRSAEKRDIAKRLDEGRKILLAVMTKRLIEAGTPVTRAEVEARASKEFHDYVEQMHVAAREADDAWIEAQYQDRIYWAGVSHEASERVERRNTR